MVIIFLRSAIHQFELKDLLIYLKLRDYSCANSTSYETAVANLERR